MLKTPAPLKKALQRDSLSTLEFLFIDVAIKNEKINLSFSKRPRVTFVYKVLVIVSIKFYKRSMF